MKYRFPLISFGFVFLVGAHFASLPAEDQSPSIDRLLSKLPPPEKLAKPPVQQALQPNDPAAKDPAIKQIVKAELAHNFPQALDLARKLTQRYPRSLAAHSIRGILAWRVRQYGEASSSFHAAIDIQPKFVFAYWGLALVEGTQKHY